MIAKILNKIKEDNVKQAMLIVPFWPTQTWFSILIAVLIFLPVRLSRHKDLLSLPHTGEMHPLYKKMCLLACVVSGNRSLRKEFQNQMPSSLPHPGENQLINNINYGGENGFFGATNGKLIRLNHLK